MDTDAVQYASEVEDHVNRSDSIYALAVTKVVNCRWHLGTVRLVAALFFTVFLQLALVGLLWQVQHCAVPCTPCWHAEVQMGSK
jgi:hypothetical protein